MYFFHSIIMRIGLIMAKCGAFLACIKKYTQQFYLSHVLTSYLHCFSCSDSHVPPRSQGSGADRRCGRDRMPRLCCRRAIPHCGSDDAASIPKSGPEIKNRCTQKVVFGEILASIPKSGLEIKNRCSLWAVLEGFLASIRKFGPEIKNRCTQKVLNREILASIPKFGLEIKNRCTHEGINRQNPASIRKRLRDYMSAL